MNARGMNEVGTSTTGVRRRVERLAGRSAGSGVRR